MGIPFFLFALILGSQHGSQLRISKERIKLLPAFGVFLEHANVYRRVDNVIGVDAGRTQSGGDRWDPD